MRQHLLPILALTTTAFSLISCGEMGGEAPLPIDSPAAVAVVETLPIDDIKDQIVEMPDGIELRPGVDIWEMAEAVNPYMVVDPHSTSVTVLPPAWEAFEPVGVDDVVFVKGVGFMVDAVDKQSEVWTYEVSEVDLGRVIWGNFRIPWEMPTTGLAESPEDIVVEDQPIYDDFGNVVRYDPLTLVDMRIYRDFQVNASGGPSGKFEFDGTVRIPATMKGVFEGRVGRFNSSYRCTNPGDDYDFCIDRLAAYAETTFSATAKMKGTITKSVPLWSPNPVSLFNKTLGVVPLGATGLSVTVQAFGRLTAEVKATGQVSASVQYDFSRTIPFGFEYINKPRQRLTGVFAIPNMRVPISGAGGRFSQRQFDYDAKLEGSAGFELGVGFSLSAAAGVVKLRGAEIKGIMEASVTYRPLQVSSDPKACAEAAVEVYGKAEARLQFEIDLRLWSWTKNISCPGDGPCAEVSTEKYPMAKGEWEGFCLDSAVFDTLLIEPIDDSSGFDDISGYDVDSVCVTRTTPPNPRLGFTIPQTTTFCATSGPSALRGRPDSTCPLRTSKVAGLTSNTEIKFGRSLIPGDVIVLVQSNSPGACNGSGKARFSLKRGNRTRMLGGGTYKENNVTLTYE
jgi:hypothetical protein